MAIGIYHLTAGSAAIDKGVDAGVTVDIDRELRPAGTGYDLSVDELWYKITCRWCSVIGDESGQNGNQWDFRYSLRGS